jgi:hypothetical protein
LVKLKPFDLTISDHALQAAIWLMVGVGEHPGQLEALPRQPPLNGAADMPTTIDQIPSAIAGCA